MPQEFQDPVLAERAKEFVMEGIRWYDLSKTGTVLEVIRHLEKEIWYSGKTF